MSDRVTGAVFVGRTLDVLEGTEVADWMLVRVGAGDDVWERVVVLGRLSVTLVEPVCVWANDEVRVAPPEAVRFTVTVGADVDEWDTDAVGMCDDDWVRCTVSVDAGLVVGRNVRDINLDTVVVPISEWVPSRERVPDSTAERVGNNVTVPRSVFVFPKEVERLRLMDGVKHTSVDTAYDVIIAAV